MKTYNFFNFQSIISTLRDSDVKNTKLLVPFEAYYGPISKDQTLEEMPFYQEYLATFDIESELAGFTLRKDFLPRLFTKLWRKWEKSTTRGANRSLWTSSKRCYVSSLRSRSGFRSFLPTKMTQSGMMSDGSIPTGWRCSKRRRRCCGRGRQEMRDYLGIDN